MSDDIHVSAVEYGTPVGKLIKLTADKKGLEKKRCTRPAKGKALAPVFDSFEEYWAWREALGPQTMMVCGTFETGADRCEIVYKDTPQAEHQISASNDFLEFRDAPSVARVDVDVKRPDEVAAMFPAEPTVFTEHQQLVDELRNIAPWLDDVAMGVVDSSSSMIHQGQTQMSGPGGMRVEFPVSDGMRIPEVLQRLHDLCWAHGYGWAFIDKGGHYQERSLVDLALARPHQPDYAAAAVIKPLTSKRRFSCFEGGVLDVDTMPGLAVDEIQAAKEARELSEEQLEPMRVRTRKDKRAELVKKHTERAPVKSAVKRDVDRMLNAGVISGSVEVQFADGALVSADDLAMDGAKSDQADCLDPLEPDYNGGAAVARFYWNDGERPGIYTFAHGGRWFHLRVSAQGLAKARKDERDDLTRLLTLLDADAVKAKVALKETAKALGLGNSFKDLASEVKRNRTEWNAPVVPDDPDLKPKPKAKKLTLHDQLPRYSLPVTDINKETGEEFRHDHVDNTEALLGKYGFRTWYDQITKTIGWEYAHGGMCDDSDNASERLFSNIRSLCKLNGLAVEALGSYMISIADKCQVNPVTDHLKTLQWDGESRIDPMAMDCTAHDDDAAKAAWRVFFLSACAAADAGVIGCSLNDDAHPSYEYILVLVSPQGRHKTKGLRELLPAPLRQFFNESVVLNVGDKDSEKKAISGWVCELGELDATFRASDVSHMKGFASRQIDEIRLPYARTPSRYRRRTVFVGTVNETNFLNDQTGNRRFMPLSISEMPRFEDEFLDQLWAEAWTRYVGGEQWWPTEAEENPLFEAAQIHEGTSVWEDRMRNLFDWEKAKHSTGKRLTATQLFTLFREYGDPSKMDLKEIGHAMAKLWRENGAFEVQGQLRVKIGDAEVKVNADNGKNRGWLIPETMRNATIHEFRAY